MTRLEKCKLAIEKGITYKEETGEIFGVKGNVLKCKDKQGYICFGIWHENKTYKLYGHQFAWFVMYNELVEMIDHINQVKTDNSKLNLRIATRELNSLNRNSLGVTYDKYSEKWISQIMVNGKNKNLGRFKEKQDAIDTYQKYKQCLINKITR